MNGSIGHLHQTYQLPPGAAPAGGFGLRLQQLAQEQLAAALTGALDRLMGADPAVYVLRRLDAHMTLTLAGPATDGQFIQAYANGLAQAIAQQIKQTPNDGVNQVRFADQADYIAHYIGDRLQGRTAQQWCYQPLRRYQGRPLAAAIGDVLLDHRADLPAILSNLAARGLIDRLLAHLDQATQQRIWSEGLGAQAGVEPASLYPLFAGACTMVGRLDGWRQTPSAVSTLFEHYLATGAAMTDWRDKSALTSTVIDILRFLHTRGYLKGADASGSPPLSERVEQLLSEFDWLDTGQLRAALLAIGATPAAGKPDVSALSAQESATQRLRGLAIDLLTALSGADLRLTHNPLDSLSNGLRLYALLMRHAPRWAGDPLATAAIRQLLGAARWFAESQNPARMLQHLRRRDRETALLTLPEHDRPSAARALDFLVLLEDVGLEVVTRLVNSRPRPKQTDADAPAPPTSQRPSHVDEALRLIGNLDDAGLGLMWAWFEHNTSAIFYSEVTRHVQVPIGDENQSTDGADYADSVHAVGARRHPGGSAVPGSIFTTAKDTPLTERPTVVTEIGHAVDTSDPSGHDAPARKLSPRMIERLLEMLPAASRLGAGKALQFVADLDAAGLAEVKRALLAAGPHAVDLGLGIQTGCAGVYLLLRAIADVRLPALAAATGFPATGSPDALAALLLALGLRWAGERGVYAGVIDPGLASLAGLDHPLSLVEMRTIWAAVEPVRHDDFQTALFERLANQRLVRREALHLHQLALAEGAVALVAGDESGALWPFGRVLDGTTTPAALVATWLDNWQTATGLRPEVVADAELAAELTALAGVKFVDTGEAAPFDPADGLAVAHTASRAALTTLHTVMDPGRLGRAATDLTILLAANALLRLWARWLPNFSKSSAPYLLHNFIRRPGWVALAERTITVEVASIPLSVVLSLAGYTAPLEKVLWLGKRDVHFTVRD